MSRPEYRKKVKTIPKSEPIDDENQSLFSKVMRIHEESMKYHEETDFYFQKTKREIILKVLLRIKENPPQFLTEDETGAKMAELDQTINELSNIIKFSRK